MKIESLTIKLGKQLQQHQWTCVTAESCTGGGLSYWITAVPGSSTWFERGLVTYSNKAKQELLGVNAATLTKFGAVSAETAQEMAMGALQHSPAQISVAITGIAGPDGGTVEKPVGTIWIASAIKQGEIITRKHLFQGDRGAIREQSIIAALELLLTLL